jgi:hypothetical protein
MRELVESVKLLYEVRLGLNDIKKDIPIEKVRHDKNESRKVDDDFYAGGDEEVEYSTSHGRYIGSRSAGGTHTVRYVPNDDKSPNSWSNKVDGRPSGMYNTKDRQHNTRHLRHMNALHNNYVKNHVLPNDTLSVEKRNSDNFESDVDQRRRQKVYDFMTKHKDFHRPDESDVSVRDQLNNGDQLRTTYIRHPKTGEAVGTSDTNEYAINRQANAKASQLVNKDNVDNQKEPKLRLGSKLKNLMNTKIF